MARLAVLCFEWKNSGKEGDGSYKKPACNQENPALEEKKWEGFLKKEK